MKQATSFIPSPVPGKHGCSLLFSFIIGWSGVPPAVPTQEPQCTCPLEMSGGFKATLGPGFSHLIKGWFGASLPGFIMAYLDPAAPQCLVPGPFPPPAIVICSSFFPVKVSERESDWPNSCQTLIGQMPTLANQLRSR